MRKIYTKILAAIFFFAAHSVSAETHIITQQNTSFNPNTLQVNVGDVIRWVWTSSSHTTTSTSVPAGAVGWNSPLNAGNPQYEYTISVPGIYTYVCTPHAAMGMTGTFTATQAQPTCNINPVITQDENTVTVTINGTGASNPLYSIDWGDGSFASNQPSDVHTYTESGTYEICLVYLDQNNLAGCYVTDCDLNVEVEDEQNNDCDVELTATVEENTVTVSAVGTGVTNGQYFIYWGDGNNEQGAEASHTYQEAGDYEICVSYGDIGPSGCTAEDCETIEIITEEPVECTVALTLTNNGNTYTATAIGTGAVTPQYAIIWGDGSVPTVGNSGNHTYTSSGEYDVCVYYTDISNTEGCTVSDCEHIEIAVGIHEVDYILSPLSAMPNPIAENTQISFSLNKPCDVQIEVLDITGKKIETIMNGTRGQGAQQITWNNQLPSGIYFVRITAGGEQQSIRVVK